MAKVFLSFSAYDRALAERLEKGIERLGHSVFVDRRELAHGAAWADAIRCAISDTDLFVTVSPQSLPRPDYDLDLELGAAWGAGKPIIALLPPGGSADSALSLPRAGYEVVPMEGRSADEIAAAILAKAPGQTAALVP